MIFFTTNLYWDFTNSHLPLPQLGQTQCVAHQVHRWTPIETLPQWTAKGVKEDYKPKVELGQWLILCQPSEKHAATAPSLAEAVCVNHKAQHNTAPNVL